MSKALYTSIIQTHFDVEKLLFEDTKSHLRDILELCFEKKYAPEDFFQTFFSFLHPGFEYLKISKGAKKPFYQMLLYQIFSCSFPIEHLRTKERLNAYLHQVLAYVSKRSILQSYSFDTRLNCIAFCMKFYQEGSFFLLEEARKFTEFTHIIERFYRGLVDQDAFWDAFSDLSRCSHKHFCAFCCEQERVVEQMRKQLELRIETPISNEFVSVFGVYGYQMDSKEVFEKNMLAHVKAFTTDRHLYLEGVKRLRIVLPTYNKSLEKLPYVISQARAITHFCTYVSIDARDIPLYIFDQSDDALFYKNRRYIRKIEKAFGIQIVHIGKKKLIKMAEKIGALDLIVTKPPDTFGYAGARNAAFLLTEKTPETAIQMGDDDLYMNVQSLFSDALTAYMHKDKDFFKTGYLFGRDTLKVYATLDLECLLEQPERFVSQVAWRDEPVLIPWQALF
jgi:hypothetical protein